MGLDALAVIDEMIARWNRKDTQAFAEMFIEDADFTDVLGQTAQGRAEIATLHQFPFTRTLRLAKLTADHVAARTLGPDVVVARVHWSMTGAVAIDDSPLPTLQGKMQVALQRGEAGWQIVSVLNQNPAGVFGKQLPHGSGFKSAAV
jgi:uncharacterized protein (TIGR02246 family)